MKDENIDFRERWKERSRQMFDSSEGRKAFNNVFDHETKKALLKLGDRKVLDRLYGTIESGKESSVFLADTSDGERVIVKIYMTQAGSFRKMEKYLRGDQRFRNFKSDRRSVINEWCKKEFKNLKKASSVVRWEEFTPYPKLKDIQIENPEEAFQKIKKNIKELWREEKIVHGDLSEYNVLMTEEGEVWIDFSQGVHKSHPEAVELLKRDVRNMASFFNRQGADIDEQEAIEEVLEALEDL
jgi:RIO kinase 1